MGQSKAHPTFCEIFLPERIVWIQLLEDTVGQWTAILILPWEPVAARQEDSAGPRAGAVGQGCTHLFTLSDVASVTQCRPPSGLEWGSNEGATHTSERAPFTVGDGGATGTKN